MDDVILTASLDTLFQSVMSKLSSQFDMKDLGPLIYFIGIFIIRHSVSIFLPQHKYRDKRIEQILLSYCKLTSTLVDTKEKLSGISGNPCHDPF